MEHKIRKRKANDDRTAILFTKQDWDKLITVSHQIVSSKTPTSLGVLNKKICQYLNMTG